jgi:hypothetical protein
LNVGDDEAEETGGSLLQAESTGHAAGLVAESVDGLPYAVAGAGAYFLGVVEHPGYGRDGDISLLGHIFERRHGTGKRDAEGTTRDGESVDSVDPTSDQAKR